MSTPAALRRPAAALLLLAGACAPRRPAAAPAPVPLATAATAGEVLGPARTRAASPPAVTARATADATATTATPAPRFAHTPGVTWDLDVLPYEGHARVQRYVALFTGNARGRFAEWLSRGTRYDALVKAKLRAGGLPEDLYYLALVESGYEPNAVSHAGAVGMWQFMAETARDVGLRVDWWVDERRDPVRATDAAVRMMRWLRGQFGSLFVAAAAYNGGPGRVSRGIAQLAVNDANAAAAAASAAMVAALDSAGPAAPNGLGDAAGPVPNASPPNAPPPPPAPSAPATGDARFFALADAGVLRSETVNYVPQLVAAALVAKEAGRYGLEVRRLDPLAYDTVRVPALTPLAAVAEVTASTRAELLELNPHLLRGLTPPGASTVVRVPEGAGDGAAEELAAMDADERRAFRRVVTRRRDTWAALAERAGVSAAVLRAYNPRLETVARGKNRGRIVGSQAVRVPTEAVQAYARAGSWDGAAPGPLPPMPAPSPEPSAVPKPKPATRTKVEAASEPEREPAREATHDASREAKAEASGRPKARAESAARAAAPDSTLYRALRVNKEAGDAAAGTMAKGARHRNTPDEARPKSAKPERPDPVKPDAGRAAAHGSPSELRRAAGADARREPAKRDGSKPSAKRTPPADAPPRAKAKHS